MNTHTHHAATSKPVVSPFVSSNPFETDDSNNATTYVLTKSGPDIDAKEFERPDVVAIEIMIQWGENVLHIEHLSPPRSFYVGEEEANHVHCDFLIPETKLGTPRAPLVIVDGSGIHLVIPRGARGWVDKAGHGRRQLENLVALGAIEPCPEWPGASQVELSLGNRARVSMGDFTFHVGVVPAGRKVSTVASRDWTSSLYVGLSLAVHASMMAAMALFMPDLGLADSETMSRDQLYVMQQYLNARAEPERKELESDVAAADQADQNGGGTGTRAVGAEGSMGNPASRNAHGAYGIQGDSKDRQIARAEAMEMAKTWGLIGVLNSGVAGDPNTPTAPWGQSEAIGSDSLSARGNMWGDSIMDASGANGLGLSGIGEGGNGSGEGIGLGSIGTIGRGAGMGEHWGFGNGSGLSGRGRPPKAPKVSFAGSTTVNGRIPPEVIQRTVRQNFGRFRMCYEGGLRSNPSLTGRVSVRFVIGRDGAVSQVGNAGSDLPSPEVVQCVTSAFYGLSFPQPDGGIVTVIYPILFTPGS